MVLEPYPEHVEYFTLPPLRPFPEITDTVHLERGIGLDASRVDAGIEIRLHDEQRVVRETPEHPDDGESTRCGCRIIQIVHRGHIDQMLEITSRIITKKPQDLIILGLEDQSTWPLKSVAISRLSPNAALTAVRAG